MTAAQRCHHDDSLLKFSCQFYDWWLLALEGLGLLRGHVHIPHDAKLFKGANEIPGKVDLPPFQTVAS